MKIIRKKSKSILDASKFYIKNYSNFKIKKVKQKDLFVPEQFLKKLDLYKGFFSLQKYRLVFCIHIKCKFNFLRNIYECASNLGYEIILIRKNNNKPTTFRQLLFLTIRKRKFTILLGNDSTKENFYFDIEFWVDSKNKDAIIAPSSNPIARKIWRRVIDDNDLFNFGTQKKLSCILNGTSEFICNFDVDYVITWINHDDKDWQKLYDHHKPECNNDGNSKSRYYNRNELKYNLRSLEEYAPWIRNIYIVSNCKPPAWLNLAHEKINWVYHSEIFEKNELPTFNSHAIEAKLHKISGLSNYYVYSNDDIMLTKNTYKSDFFYSNGLCKIKLESFGNVCGDINEAEPDYLNAARNCQQLIFDKFQKKPTHLHTHSPQSMRKDIIVQMEQDFKANFLITANNKFRAINDIGVTSFLFHHYAFCTGAGVPDYTTTLLIQKNKKFKKLFHKLLQSKGQSEYLSVCVNDGENSHLNQDWNNAITEFLNVYFKNKSGFEK